VSIIEILLSSKLSRDTLRSQEQCALYGISFMFGLSQRLATVLGFHLWWSEIQESVLYWASTSPASLAECSCDVRAAFSLSRRKWWDLLTSLFFYPSFHIVIQIRRGITELQHFDESFAHRVLSPA
jgi:hypothetical protein